jgi:hypothetical protein
VIIRCVTVRDPRLLEWDCHPTEQGSDSVGSSTFFRAVPCGSQPIATFLEDHGNVEALVFESCHSTWLFDTPRFRFRRILKADVTNGHPVATEWRPYYGLEVDPDSETFTVLLNPEGTRLLRSWRHTHDCVQCGGHTTAEFSLDDLRRAVG